MRVSHCLPVLIMAIVTCPQLIHCRGRLKPPILAGFDPAPRGFKRELICNASQPTNIGSIGIRYEWFKDDKENKPFSREQKFVFDPVTLKHKFYTGRNGTEVSGKYMCRITNPEGLSAVSEWRDLFVYIPCEDYRHDRSHPYKLSVSPPNPTIGSTFTIRCQIHRPTSGRVSWYMGSSALQLKLVACAPSTRYICTNNTGTYRLQIENARKSDFVYWKCSQEGIGCASDPLKLNLPPPGKPRIIGHGSSSRGITAVGEDLRLECKSTSRGDQYEWYKDGNELSRTSILSIKVTKESAGSYICVARSSEGWTKSNIYSLTVYYKPDAVTISSAKTDFHVGERNKFTCSQSGGKLPESSLKLYVKRYNVHVAQKLLGETPFHIEMRKEHNRAQFYCETQVKGFQSLTEKSKSLTTYVTFPNTKVEFTDQSSTVKEGHVGHAMTFTCQTDESNPVASIKWYIFRGGSWRDVTKESTSSGTNGDNGEKIAISKYSVTATKSLTHVRCRSFDGGFETGYSDTQINVKWSASELKMVNKPKSDIFVGDSSAIKCETDSSNSGSSEKILWYRNDSQITTGSITPSSRGGGDGGNIYTSILKFTATKKDNQANYECKMNDRPTLEEDVTITVRWFATKIKMVEAPNSPIKEGASFIIKCETDSGNSGRPEVISWYRNGQQVTTGVHSSARPVVYGGTIYISQLNVTAKVEDNQAKYDCEINNWLSLKKGVTITVHFKPKWNPNHTLALTAACKPGDEAKFVLHVIANPPPTVTWYLPDNRTASDQGFAATTVNDTTFILSKGTITVEDYRNYTAMVKNTIGATLFVFELQSRGPPQSPCCLRLLNATAVSLTLSFKSNFSGGTPQIFSVAKRTSKGPWNMVIDGIEDPGFGIQVTEKIKALSSSTRYEFRVLATNKDGNTSSNTVEATTKAKPNVMFRVQRASNKVTITWHRLKESYSKIRIKYTPVDGGRHAYHTVTDPEDLGTSFSIDSDTTYHYSLEVFDGEDKVYVSSLRPAEKWQINIVVIGAGIGGVLFLLIIATVAVAVVFIFKKRRSEKGGASIADVGMMRIEELPTVDEYAVVDRNKKTRGKKEKNSNLPVSEGVVYAEVNKKNKTPVLPVTDEYAQVDFKKKAAKKAKVTFNSVENEGQGVVYAEVNKKGKASVQPVTDEYAVVDYKNKTAKQGANAVPSDSGDVYAEVCKPKKPPIPSKSKNQAVYSNTVIEQEETDYVDIEDFEPSGTQYNGPPKAYKVGVDGTVYADFRMPPPTNPDVIRGKETIEDEYASVDFTRQAPILSQEEAVNIVELL